MSFKYKHTTVGGTFDRFHSGHRSLIDEAFKVAERITIAITSDNFTQKKKTSLPIQSFYVRKKEIENYIKQLGTSFRTSFSKLDDIYGISRYDNTLDSIVVSPETRANAVAINKLRKKNGLAALEIITVAFIHSSDGRIIHSERIRTGEINRTGDTYAASFSGRKTLFMPQMLRDQLRTPLGKVFRGKEDKLDIAMKSVVRYLQSKEPVMTITVGDIVTAELDRIYKQPDVAVIDFKTRRRDLDAVKSSKMLYRNKAGTIHPDSVRILHSLIKRFTLHHEPVKLLVKGEEDLLALPAILLAPLGSVVIYGLFNVGVVVVEVTEESKKTARLFVEKFR